MGPPVLHGVPSSVAMGSTLDVKKSEAASNGDHKAISRLGCCQTIRVKLPE